MNDENPEKPRIVGEPQTAGDIVEHAEANENIIRGTRTVSQFPRKENPFPNKTQEDSHSPVFQALEDLGEAIRSLDNQLAEFYDDIKPVLTPETSGDKTGTPSDPEGPMSEISSMINDKRDFINRITNHLGEIRHRIEL